VRPIAAIDYTRKVIRDNRWSFLLGALLLALGTMNVLLIRQNLKLRALLEESAPKRLKTGDIVTPFTAHDLNGNSIEIKYAQDSPRRVLLFFSPSCRYSASQFVSWIPFIHNASASKTEVLLLAMDTEQRSEINDFLKAVNSPPQSEHLKVALIPKNVGEAYKLSITPTTVVVSNEGEVQKAWNGLVDSQDLTNTFMSMNLSTPRN
jgi:peroxiredoxin